MRRRDFVKGIVGSATAWPLAARAQQAAMPVIGYLSSRSPSDSAAIIAAFHKGLSEAGYVKGRNTAINPDLPLVTWISLRRWPPILSTAKSHLKFCCGKRVLSGLRSAIDDSSVKVGLRHTNLIQGTTDDR